MWARVLSVHMLNKFVTKIVLNFILFAQSLFCVYTAECNGKQMWPFAG